MWFVVARARSTAAANYVLGYPEAFVSCWINDFERERAISRVHSYIAELGWRIVEISEDYPVLPDSYSAEHESRKYYEQALVDDEVFVFYVSKEGAE